MATEYTQLEPVGFGQRPFGDPDTEDYEFRRGFGEKLTNYQTYTED